LNHAGRGVASWFFGIWAAYLLGAAHFYAGSTGGDGLYIPFNACGWIFASLMTGYGLWAIYERHEVTFSRLQGWIWAGALLALVPLAYPFPFREWAIPRLLGLFGGLLFLFSLYQCGTSREDRFNVLYLVLGAVGIEAVLGLLQFYFPAVGKWVGYSSEVNQPFGVFLQRNVLASFLATGLALATWLLANDPGAAKWKRWLCYGLMPPVAMLLVVGQSRAGQVGAIIAMALLWPALVRERRESVSRVLALIALGLVAGWLSLGAAESRLGETVGTRPLIWSQSLKLFAESPWLGQGYGGFESAYLRAYGVAKGNDAAFPVLEENLDHPHNEILFWAVEGGILPVIGIAIAIAGFLLVLRRGPWRRSLAFLALVAPIVLHTQTEFPFDMSTTHWFVFLLLVFVTDQEMGQVGTYPYTSRLLAPVLAVAVPLLTVPFMVTAIHSNWLMVEYVRSGYRDVTKLLDVVNRVAVLRDFEYSAYTMRMRSGRKSDLQAYVDWGRRTMPHQPRSLVYINMVLALDAMGKPEEAQKVRREAAQLYPHNPILNGTISIAVARGLEKPGPEATPYMKKELE